MAANSCNDLEKPETSSVTVSSEVGGYDCDFVESPADDLLCKICHFPAREPILVACCGYNFCNYCLKRHHQSRVDGNVNCPYCHKEQVQSVLDKRTERYVLNLKVFCPHKRQGCRWIGELRSMKNHMNKSSNSNIGCPFTELQCSNGCGVMMQRRLVEGHLKSECELREVKCEYCNTTGSYQWINSSHCEECPKYPVECPNHCEVGHVRREEISVHLKECPLAIVECPYAAVGCESVVRRKEEMEHVMRSVGQHMEFSKSTILDNQNELKCIKEDLRNAINILDVKEVELDSIKRDLQAATDRLDAKEQAMMDINKALLDKLKESEETQSQLKMAITAKGRELDEVKKNAAKNNRISQTIMQQLQDKLEKTEQLLQDQVKISTHLQLQVEAIFNSNWLLRLNYLANSGNEVVPVVIKLSEFEKHKKSNNCLYFRGFYTRDMGYKICLTVFTKGRIRESEDHVAVGVCMMKGVYDHHLTWPVKGTLTVQLLNQLSDSNHSEPVKFHFDGSSKYCLRVEIVAHRGIWCDWFMPHKRLSYDADKNCQYLKDDCVFFRVCNFH